MPSLLQPEQRRLGDEVVSCTDRVVRWELRKSFYGALQ